MSADELSAVDRVSLGLSRSYYSLARALRLNKLKDLLASGASITLDAPVWLLGSCYSCPATASEAQQEEALACMLHHFQSIPWMSYRTGFTGIAVGSLQLHSDAGWGCTLRSGQMILAQGLLRHVLGRQWRWPEAPHLSQQQQQQHMHKEAPAAPGVSTGAAAEAPPKLARLLELFWDTPAESNAFSLHNLCRAGQRCGVVPGRWLGPWVMCRTLEAAAVDASLQRDLGLTVAVLAESGGGAPLLVVSRFESAFPSAEPGGGSRSGGANDSGQSHSQEQQEQQQHNGSEGCVATGSLGAAPRAGAAAARTASVALVPMDSCTLAVEAPSRAAIMSQLNSGGKGLVLLVPLVLGLGKLNPRYIPQLEAVLAMPQSIGIVGGRPSSSLYFVGYQHQQHSPGYQQQQHHQAQHAQHNLAALPAVSTSPGDAAALAAASRATAAFAAGSQGGAATDSSGTHLSSSSNSGGSSVIYLDPHQVQEAACCQDDWRSFRLGTPRTMPLASIDPSLALGFYCANIEEYSDLCNRLEALEHQSGGAPLVCVTTQEAAAARYNSPHETEWEPDEMSSVEEDEAAREHGNTTAGTAAAQDEEPELLPPDVVAEATAAMPPRHAAAVRGTSLAGSTGPAAGAAASASSRSGVQQQPLPQGQGQLSPRQMSRGWELL